MPGSDIPEFNFFDVIHFDKWVHAGLFATLTFLLSFPFKKYLPRNHFVYIAIPIAALIYGILMEFVQKYFQRDYDVADMVADGVGCLMGYAFIQFQLSRRLKKAENK